MKGGYNRSLIKEEARQQIEEGLEEWFSDQEILRQAKIILDQHTEEMDEIVSQLIGMIVRYPWERVVLDFYFNEMRSFFNE